MPESDPVSTPAPSRAYSTERVVLFSDAVVAIAITLLAIELPVPDADSVHGILRQLGDESAEYGAFLCSFFVIGAAWSTHHHLFDFVPRLDAGAIGRNLQWLFLIVVTPFATKFMTGGEGDGTSIRMAFYGFVQTVLWLAMLRLYRYLRRHDLLVPAEDPSLRWWVERRILLTGVFLASIPLAFVSPWAAGGCWIATPLIIRGHRIVRERHPGAEPPGELDAR